MTGKGKIVDPGPFVNFRKPQDEVFRSTLGMLWLIWRRQFGKSHTLGAVGMDWMMESVELFQASHDLKDLADVFYVSASLRLGQENVRKEAAIWRDGMIKLRNLLPEKDRDTQFESIALDDKKRFLDLDAICDLFEHQKLEARLKADHVNFCRSITVAPNPDTAVGWSGHIILDEVGRMPEFRELWEALEPIVSSQQRFKIRGATTPPPDDSHYSYELLAPTIDGPWPISDRGNIYTSRSGMTVHRVDAWDGYAAGVPLYDLKTREPITPDESRARALDKIAWDRNYGCKFIQGGASAISLMALTSAQTLGRQIGTRGIDITDQLVAA